MPRAQCIVLHAVWLVMTMAASSCRGYPEAELAAARQEALRAVAKVPTNARDMLPLVVAAEQLAAGDRNALPWRRDPQQVELAWRHLSNVATGERARFDHGVRAKHTEFTTLERAATRRVEGAQEQIRQGHLDSRAAAASRRAAVALAEARLLASRSDFKAASTRAQIAIEQADVVEQRWEDVYGRFDDDDSLETWSNWARETIAESRRERASAIVVDKLRRLLTVYSDGRAIDTFTVELGARGLHRKTRQGDRATPEGRYRVTQVKLGSDTAYYKALLINYPNQDDLRRVASRRRHGRGRAATRLGGLIEIHGEGGLGSDWTTGCVALRNDDMDRLVRMVRPGAAVTIVGTLRGPLGEP